MRFTPAGDVNLDGFEDINLHIPSGSLVLFGSDELVGFKGSFQSLTSEQAYRGDAMESFGDVNGDGFTDFVERIPNDRPGPIRYRILYSGFETSILSGSGPITEQIDISPSTEVRYVVEGELPEGADLGPMENAMTVAAGPLRVDENPVNNTATQITAIQGTGDINRDGFVDFADFLILSMNFGQEADGDSDGDLTEIRKSPSKIFLSWRQISVSRLTERSNLGCQTVAVPSVTPVSR